MREENNKEIHQTPFGFVVRVPITKQIAGAVLEGAGISKLAGGSGEGGGFVCSGSRSLCAAAVWDRPVPTRGSCRTRRAFETVAVFQGLIAGEGRNTGKTVMVCAAAARRGIGKTSEHGQEKLERKTFFFPMEKGG